MVDADREKISKSKQGQGGYEKPQTADAYVKKWGADVVRLWVASQDFRNDIVVSEERVGKVSETYRVIRNTMRYQLANLFDFDPARDAVAVDRMTELDRWILHEFSRVESEAWSAFGASEFHTVYQRVSQFAAVELSAIYHDTVKDRLYTDAADSPRRRSTQTALHRLVAGLCQILSPFLVFTTEEAWEFIAGRPAESVHLSTWEPSHFSRPADEVDRWTTLLRVRSECLPELEKARQARIIGKALEARMTLSLPAKESAMLRGETEALRELLNVSQLSLDAGDMLKVVVARADGQKCERCWHWETDVGSNPAHPTLCARCVRAVESR